MSREHAILASIEDRSNALEFDVGPSKESHESGSTDESTEELEHVNEYHKVSYSDLTDDEFIRRLFEDQNDMHADRNSREISYFMDSNLRDSTIDTLDQSKEMETTDNLSTMQNTFYDNEEISNLGYKGILFKFNH